MAVTVIDIGIISGPPGPVGPPGPGASDDDIAGYIEDDDSATQEALNGRYVSVADGSVIVGKADGRVFASTAHGEVIAEGTAGTAAGSVGADATVIAAADAAIATGGTVVFQPGTYWSSTSIAHSPATVWRGTGNSPITGYVGVVFRYVGEGSFIVIDGAGSNNLRGHIEGIRILYAGTLGTATTSIGVAIANLQDFVIEDCYIANFKRCVQIADAAAIYIERCYIFGAAESGVDIRRTSDSWLIHTQTSGKVYGLYGEGAASLQLVASRPQSSGEANIRMVDTGFFSMSNGFCDSADISTAPGAKNAVQLHNVDYVKINGVQFYANGTDADIVLTADDPDSMASIAINGNVFNSGVAPKVAVKIPSTTGEIKRLAMVGNVVDNDTEPLLSIEAPTGDGSINHVALSGNVALGGFVGLNNVANVTTVGNAGWDDMPWVAKTGTFHTLTATERRIRAVPASANQQIVLPGAAVRYGGMRVIVKKSAATAFVITVSGNSANIDGATTMTLTDPYDSVMVEWDSNVGRWHIIASNGLG